MSKKETNTEQETTKKKRQPVIVLGIIKNKEDKLEEYEFEGKAVVRKFVEDECKGKFNKSGWISMKDGGQIKFIMKPSYLVYSTVTRYQEVSLNDL